MQVTDAANGNFLMSDKDGKARKRGGQMVGKAVAYKQSKPERAAAQQAAQSGLEPPRQGCYARRVKRVSTSFKLCCIIGLGLPDHE